MVNKFKALLNGREWESAVVNTSDIVFSIDVVKACEANYCGRYNKCWTCPPALSSLDSQKAKVTAFNKAFIFTTKFGLEDSFDFDGMMLAKKEHDSISREFHETFGKTNPVFGAGGCTFCEKCAYPEPCRFPSKAFSSVEGCGIDVTALSRTANVHYINGENTVTYFTMVLFNE